MVRSNNAGNERFAAGAYDEAISEYRQAQAEEPDRAEPYYNASNAYNRQAQLDAALAQAQQALKTAASDLAAKSWYNLGNAFFDAKRWSEAITAYQQALRINSGDVDAKHNLELALKNLDEQQQQQEHQRQQDQENQQDQDGRGSENSDRSQTSPTTPAPTGQSETLGERNQAASEPSREAKDVEGMTPEQALQLLQALVGASETLQERLQQIHRVPGPPPERDW